MSATAQATVRSARLMRLAAAPIHGAAALLGAAFSPRGLALGMVGLFALLAVINWVQHPLGAERDAFSVSVFADEPPLTVVAIGAPLEAAWRVSSPGAILLTLAAVGALVVLWRPARATGVVGLLLCAAIGCQLAVVLNHPERIDALDHETHLSRFLVTLLKETVKPDVEVGVRARGGFSGAYIGRASFLQDAVYVPTTRLTILALAAVYLLCAGRGTWRGRLRTLLLWGLGGILLAGALAWERCRAEAHWILAVDAESRGELDRATRHAAAALHDFSPLARVPRTWLLVGKIDYQREELTPAAHFFVANQWALNGETRRAVEELQGLALRDEPVPQATRWLARAISGMAFELYEAGDSAGAEEAWQRAVPFSDPDDLDQLCLAVLAARRERGDLSATATLIESLLPRVANRSARAALLAVLGDCYFQSGRIHEAREYYAQSLDLYSLPKQINYRAIRGLLGM